METTNGPTCRKRNRDAEPTSLMSLGDDMLGEILTRLPSLPSLASAALASPRLCSVASSPAVSGRFLSRAPLLGYFASVTRGAVPAFHRALLRRDRHLAAVVRRGDFHLTGLGEYEWRVMDCRHGLLLLSSGRYLAVFDPISQSQSPLRMTHNHKSVSSNTFHCFLPACSVSPTSFRVLSLEVDASKWHLLRSQVKKVCDVTAGVVLLSMGTENGAIHYYAFRLNNALQPKLQLEAEFFTSSGWVRPYFMAWPRLTLKAGSSNTKESLKDQEAGGSKKKKTSVKDQEAGSSKKN